MCRPHLKMAMLRADARVFDELDPAESKPGRQRLISTFDTLLLTIYRLSTGCKLSAIVAQWGGSGPSWAAYHFWHGVKAIYEALKDTIRWPQTAERIHLGQITCSLLPGAVAITDGTVHQIERPSSGQEVFYRGDKGYHFISSQVTVDWRGRLLHVQVGFPGHNNDRGNFIRSELFERQDEFFTRLEPVGGEAYREFVLADGGYYAANDVVTGAPIVAPVRQDDRDLVGPALASGLTLRNQALRRSRVVVENTISYVQQTCLIITGASYEGERETFPIVIHACFRYVAWLMAERNSYPRKADWYQNSAAWEQDVIDALREEG